MAKHYENDFIKITQISEEDAEKLKKDAEKGIKIYTDFGEFVFFPSKVITDPVGEPILYIKFNHKRNWFCIIIRTIQKVEKRQMISNYL